VIANTCDTITNCAQGLEPGAVGILLGNGDGTFQPTLTYPSGGNRALTVAIGDLNGDGKLDLVVGNDVVPPCTIACSTVAVLVGNGDGTFESPNTFLSGGQTPFGVVIADFNRDGKPDVVVAHLNSGVLGVLLGNGEATFQPVALYPPGGVPESVAVADVNGDGKQDLLGGLGGAVGVLLGNGDGTFKPAVTYATGGTQSISIAAGDLNSDGKPDIVVANYVFSPAISVLIGNGDGSFQPPVLLSSGGFYPHSLTLGDVNRDAILDLCVADIEIGISVLLGNGDGTFQSPVFFGSGGLYPSSVAVADLNSDGKPDLAVSNWSGGTNGNGAVGVLLNNPGDTIPPVITISATPRVLAPPNGQLVPVTIAGKITDSASGVNASTAEYRVIDEYRLVQPKGKMALDSAGNYRFTILLRASRLWNDLNGRQYTIRVNAKDNAGSRGVNWARVTVPH
jgi:hypothetical protein